ncbi:PhoH family protein [Tuwongella immobilis]|uniref:Uncharacterized protein n=1 Tax=Tuwongella immobilis TaxID=692036 RepID=A0A6C2YKJ9_9BACT|nr:PhoH family protein [Tuwongella immobilis]VIP01759.1 unnamed protein product [Tuwongella immobilis]VTR99364.1 unnamed protein product [Tuwongella immobilis]
MSATMTHGADQPTTRGTGRFLIPQAVASFDNHMLEIRLNQDDPRIADKAADLVERLEIKPFAYMQGTDTNQPFVIDEKGTLDGQMGYYLTDFVHRKAIGETLPRQERLTARFGDRWKNRQNFIDKFAAID